MLYNLNATYKDFGISNLGRKSREIKEYIKKSNLKDYVALFTCNRAELYSTEFLRLNGLPSLEGRNAIGHLFRVSCSLDSMVIGENEILAQIKNAYNIALLEGHCSDELSSIFGAAIRIGRTARAKTKISHGKTSIASIAVDHVLEDLGIKEKNALIIGSGMLAGKLAVALKNKKIDEIILSNRNIERAREIAKKVGGQAHDLNKLPELLKTVNLVFSATSAPHAIITSGKIPRDKKITLVDLAVPSDVSEEVSSMKNVKILKLEFFEKIIKRNLEEKKMEIAKVENIIGKEIERFKF